MSASNSPSLLHATLAPPASSQAASARGSARRPATGRLRAWLARRSRDRLLAAGRALLAELAAAPGEALSLDGQRGTPASRLARLRAAATASIDTVISIGALADAPEVALLLAEVKRVLRPGGRLLFAEPVSGPAGSRLRRLQRAWGRIWRTLAGTANQPRDLWNDLKLARFGQLHFQHAALPGLAGLPVPYIVGQASMPAVVPGAAAPLARPARPSAVALSWPAPAFAFFGN